MKNRNLRNVTDHSFRESRRLLYDFTFFGFRRPQALTRENNGDQNKISSMIDYCLDIRQFYAVAPLRRPAVVSRHNDTNCFFINTSLPDLSTWYVTLWYTPPIISDFYFLIILFLDLFILLFSN